MPRVNLKRTIMLAAKSKLNFMTPEEIDVYTTSVRWTVSHKIVIVL